MTAALIGFLGTALGTPVAAQVAAQSERPGWAFSFTPYLWFTGLHGNVGVGPLVAPVDLSFGDVLDNLDIGLMGAFEARRDPWVVRTDMFYVSVSQQAGPVEVTSKQFMLQPEVGHVILRRPWGGVDALVGARYWHLGLDLTDPTAQPQAASADKDWVDVTVGAGWRYRAGDRWRLYAKADLGAGGADFTWQALGGAGYDLGSCCTLTAAYRYLDVDYGKDDGFVYDVHFNGPAVGMTFRF
jgi:hypothetical protein